jgi:hypothetical protein
MSGPYDNVKVLLAFFQAHPDQTFSTDDVQKATEIPAGSLRGAFRVLQQGHKQATQPSRGFYRWEGAKPASRRAVPANDTPKAAPVGAKLFELVGGPTSKGELVLQSEAGDLYLAHKL